MPEPGHRACMVLTDTPQVPADTHGMDAAGIADRLARGAI
jgi:hypothetical protein